MGTTLKMASALMNVVRRRAAVGVRNFAAEVKGSSATAGDHAGGARRWKILTFVVAIPGVIVCYVNSEKKEAEHKAHYHRPEFIAYEHLRLRTKKFPWGDGNHSLFHSPEVNALPDGYEDEL